MDKLLDDFGTMAIARIKKPHRHFMPGDLIIGMLADGMANNLVCWGWSSKHRRIVGGNHGFRLHYCGWERLPKRFHRAAKNAQFENASQYDIYAPNGRGYLRIIKWIENKSANTENPPQLRDAAWLRRLLKELSCGNMPLSREEATPSKRTFTKAPV